MLTSEGKLSRGAALSTKDRTGPAWTIAGRGAAVLSKLRLDPGLDLPYTHTHTHTQSNENQEVLIHDFANSKIKGLGDRCAQSTRMAGAAGRGLPGTGTYN